MMLKWIAQYRKLSSCSIQEGKEAYEKFGLSATPEEAFVSLGGKIDNEAVLFKKRFDGIKGVMDNSVDGRSSDQSWDRMSDSYKKHIVGWLIEELDKRV